jgi:NhaP-type Na+/H+ or K+/H+ antiporter
MPEDIAASLVLVLILAAAANALAWLLRLPSILLLLGVGFLAGPVAGVIRPDALFGPLLLPLVSLSVALILFEGGLGLRFREIRGAGRVVWSLVSLGVIVTGAIAALGGYLVIGLDAGLACLLGAILCLTGPTVVLPLLEFVRPRGPVGPILKWEGIVIDPIGALLAVIVFELVLGRTLDSAAMHAGLALGRSVLAGASVGMIGAALMVLLIRYHVVPEALHSVISTALVLGAFIVSDRVQHESGLLAVTLMGVALANQGLADIRGIAEFKEKLRQLLLSSVFIVLSARLRLEVFQQIGWDVLLFVVLLIAAARPLSVVVSTVRSSLSWRQRVFLMWVAPRGIVAAAVASVFSLALEQAGYRQARLLLPVTFSTIVLTVAFYGLTLRYVGRWLGVAEHNAQGILIAGAHKISRELAAVVAKAGYRVALVDTNPLRAAEARGLGLEAYHGSILSDELLLRLDLAGIGRLLALTPNEEVNYLATEKFARTFGRANVFQLEPKPDARGKRSLHIHVPALFSHEATYPTLSNWIADGAKVKATRLTQEFDYAAYRERYEGAFIPMLVEQNGRLTVITAAAGADPRPGQTLISLVRSVDGVAESQDERATT